MLPDAVFVSQESVEMSLLILNRKVVFNGNKEHGYCCTKLRSLYFI